jgi:hypothetical protein
MSDSARISLAVLAGFMLGAFLFLGIDHRKPCQMHLSNVTMGDQQQ